MGKNETRIPNFGELNWYRPSYLRNLKTSCGFVTINYAKQDYKIFRTNNQ